MFDFDVLCFANKMCFLFRSVRQWWDYLNYFFLSKTHNKGKSLYIPASLSHIKLRLLYFLKPPYLYDFVYYLCLIYFILYIYIGDLKYTIFINWSIEAYRHYFYHCTIGLNVYVYQCDEEFTKLKIPKAFSYVSYNTTLEHIGSIAMLFIM